MNDSTSIPGGEMQKSLGLNFRALQPRQLDRNILDACREAEKSEKSAESFSDVLRKVREEIDRD